MNMNYYFQENEIGLSKWHSYSYWSCHQQYEDWKKYWTGYHQLCNKYNWNVKWEWLLGYRNVTLKSEPWWNGSHLKNWTWQLSTKKIHKQWWLMCLFLSGVGIHLGREMNGVVLPSRTQKMTLLKSPHTDKKSREQFHKKRWSLVWKMYYGGIGYMTSTQALHM